MLWRHRVIRRRFLVRRSYLQVLFRGKGHQLQNDPQIDGLLRNPSHMVNSKTMEAHQVWSPEQSHAILSH
jgi:hypothetical protein